MRLGTASAGVTPAVGVMMAGSTRRRASVGVDDPLLCKALVFESGGTRLAIVTLDLIALSRAVSDRAKAVITSRIGLPPDHILVNCSHTHSGPYTVPALDPDELPDEAYLARVEAAIVGTVTEAAGDLRPVTLACATGVLPGVGHNRRLLRPDGGAINSWLASAEEWETLPGAGPVDEALAAWVFLADAHPVAALWSYTLHVNTHFGTSFSGDYPAAVAAALRAELGERFFAVFLSGACGDVNLTRGLTHADVCERVASAVMPLVRQAQPVADETLAAAAREITLAVRDREPFQEAEIRAKWPSAFDVFENEHRLLSSAPQDSLTTTVQALRLGPGAIATTPGETFVQLGLDLKARSPFAPTVVTELTNDYVGYIPTREAYAQGGYECFRARTARVAPGSGEAIVSALADLLVGLQ